MSWINLHTHSDYSNLRMLDSINQLSQIFKRCKELNMSGVAITDHESLSGHIKAIQYVSNQRGRLKNKYEEEQDEEKKKKIYQDLIYWNNFKLVLGNEIYLTRNNLTKQNYVKGQDKYYHFILLAKDEEGHRQLRELSTRAWSHSFRQFIERVPTYYKDIEEVIKPNPGHLIASTACLGSEFANLIREYLDTNQSKQSVKKIDKFVNWCIDIFGKDNFYIELQASDNQEQHEYNECALAYAKARNLKVIVTTDAHYIRKEDRPIHKAYLNAGEGDREVDAFYSGTYLMDEEDVKEHMVSIDNKEIDIMFQNTLEIGSKIKEYDLHHQEIVPRVKLGKNIIVMPEILHLVEKKDYINRFLNSSSEQDQYYIKNILNGLVEKINPSLWKSYINRIEIEVAEVWEITQKIGNELSSYFNTVAKVIEIMWTEGDSLVGISRGSAGGFVTNYLLNITQMDPIKENIDYYWRFIHRERPELPKIA